MSETMRVIGAVGGVGIEDPASFAELELPVPELPPRDGLVRVESGRAVGNVVVSRSRD